MEQAFFLITLGHTLFVAGLLAGPDRATYTKSYRVSRLLLVARSFWLDPSGFCHFLRTQRQTGFEGAPDVFPLGSVGGPPLPPPHGGLPAWGRIDHEKCHAMVARSLALFPFSIVIGTTAIVLGGLSVLGMDPRLALLLGAIGHLQPIPAGPSRTSIRQSGIRNGI